MNPETASSKEVATEVLTGRLLLPCQPAPDVPLIVFVHGGGTSGRYFELPGFSTVAAVTARGFAAFLVDRPGHGTSPPADGEPIVTAAAALPDLVEAALAVSGRTSAVIVGHSIGGAVALTAAAQADHRVTGLCLSGIGDRPSAAIVAWLARARARPDRIEPDAAWFFGPPGSFDWRAPGALRVAAEPWRLPELEETICRWPGRWRELAAQVRVPIHYRLAEHERIWTADPETLDRIAASFSATRMLDCAMLPGGGHLYEIHRRGPELIRAQLSFIEALPARGGAPERPTMDRADRPG